MKIRIFIQKSFQHIVLYLTLQSKIINGRKKVQTVSVKDSPLWQLWHFCESDNKHIVSIDQINSARQGGKKSPTAE